MADKHEMQGGSVAVGSGMTRAGLGEWFDSTLALLPPRSIRAVDGRWGGQYGAFAAAASYAGIDVEPVVRWGEWQHGWRHPMENVHPEWVAGGGGRVRERNRWHHRLWVFRADQEQYLRSCGLKYVRAIGSPMVYVRPGAIERIPRSLLLMPPHATQEWRPAWDTAPYMAFVTEIRENFDHVAACVSADCVRQGLWIREFQSVGIPVLTGADIRDRNSLLRMAVLFSRFECVTMPSRSSALAYAAFWGARASIAGPKLIDRTESRRDQTIYRTSPELFEISCSFASIAGLRSIAPQFLVHPAEAPLARDWGEWQLGLENRLSPHELRREFRWTRPWRLLAEARAVSRHVRAAVNRPQ